MQIREYSMPPQSQLSRPLSGHSVDTVETNEKEIDMVFLVCTNSKHKLTADIAGPYNLSL